MIIYRAGYKYQLADDYKIHIDIEHDINTEYIKLDPDGVLLIKEGYAWDGPSGPTVDTKTFMRGSLVHDALYQLMREGHLEQNFRGPADKILAMICKEDGMIGIRRWWVYRGVKYFAKGAAKKKNKRPRLTAP